MPYPLSCPFGAPTHYPSESTQVLLDDAGTAAHKKNYQQAAGLYHLAAERGDLGAKGQFAMMILNGNVPGDKKLAVGYLKEAAAQDAPSQLYYADLLIEGNEELGIPKDETAGIRLWELGKSKIHPILIQFLGKIIQDKPI